MAMIQVASVLVLSYELMYVQLNSVVNTDIKLIDWITYIKKIYTCYLNNFHCGVFLLKVNYGGYFKFYILPCLTLVGSSQPLQ